MNRPYRFFRIFFIILWAFPALAAGATVYQSIDSAIKIFPQQQVEAVRILTQHYKSKPKDWIRIKSLLQNREQYALYQAFLQSLVPEQKVMQELVRIDFLMGDYGQARDHLQQLLVWDSPEKSGSSHAEYLKRDGMIAVLSPSLTNALMRQTLMWAYLSTKDLRSFDTLLMTAPLSSYYTPVEVKDYILRSWSVKSRDVGALIHSYGLQSEPGLKPLLLVSYYNNRQYARMLRFPAPRNKAEYTTLEIDYPFLISQAYFYTGDYKSSMERLNRCYYPWRYDLEALSLLNNLGLSRWKQARSSLSRLKSQDDREFFTIFLDLVEHRTNDLDKKLVRYHTYTAMERRYQVDVMLLSYTWFRDRDSIDAAVELVRQHILHSYLPRNKQGQLAGLYQDYNRKQYDSKYQDEVLASFSRYQQAVVLREKGELKLSEQILLDIMENEKSSTLIRSLAVYQLRMLSQDSP